MLRADANCQSARVLYILSVKLHEESDYCEYSGIFGYFLRFSAPDYGADKDLLNIALVTPSHFFSGMMAANCICPCVPIEVSPRQHSSLVRFSYPTCFSTNVRRECFKPRGLFLV